MPADQDKTDQPATKQGTRRMNEAGEEQIYVLGGWAPKQIAEQYLAREMRLVDEESQRTSVRKVVSHSALPGRQQNWSRDPAGVGRIAHGEQIHRAGHRRSGPREVLIELFAREECALTVQEIDKQLKTWLRAGCCKPPGRHSQRVPRCRGAL